jgi:hypothetical protein
MELASEWRVKTRKLEPLRQVPSYLANIKEDMDFDLKWKESIFEKNENGFVTKLQAKQTEQQALFKDH